MDFNCKNYEMIEGAQLSNSFIVLMALNESEEPEAQQKFLER
jgi:hypothetical protein